MASISERYFSWACGKCGSGAIYRDGDAIACPVCGTRYYAFFIGTGNGAAPVKKEFEKQSVLVVSGHFKTQRMENIITKSERFTVGKGEGMSERGICVECGKERAIIARKRCWSCYQKGRKKGNGEEGAAAAKAAAGDWQEKSQIVQLLKPGISVPPEAQEIPVTLRIAVEISVRVSCSAAANQ